MKKTIKNLLFLLSLSVFYQQKSHAMSDWTTPQIIVAAALGASVVTNAVCFYQSNQHNAKMHELLMNEISRANLEQARKHTSLNQKIDGLAAAAKTDRQEKHRVHTARLDQLAANVNSKFKNLDDKLDTLYATLNQVASDVGNKHNGLVTKLDALAKEIEEMAFEDGEAIDTMTELQYKGFALVVKNMNNNQQSIGRYIHKTTKKLKDVTTIQSDLAQRFAQLESDLAKGLSVLTQVGDDASEIKTKMVVNSKYVERTNSNFTANKN